MPTNHLPLSQCTRTESELHLSCARILRQLGAFFHHSPNEGALVGDKEARARQWAAMHAKGTISGIADLEIFACNGVSRLVFVELKESVGKQSKAQHLFEFDCMRYRVPYYVVRSEDELLKVIEKEYPT
jgi:hypothetical protein